MTEPETPHAGILLPTIVEGWGGVQAIDAPRRVSRLAANIGRTMPEYYTGEHLQTVQVLVTSSGRDSMIECLKIFIYQISNNAMAPLWNDQQWEATLDLFSRADLLCAALDDKGVRERSLTARAFLDNLFRAVINAVTGGIPMRKKTRERALGLIKGLLSSGQDPNICINLGLNPNHYATPLERAVGAAQPALAELLLIAGADPGRACKCSRHRSLMDFALTGKDTTGNKVRMIKLLLRHTRLTNLEKVLHAAIKLRDPDLVEQVVEHGPCLLASTVGAEYTFCHDTALSVAATVDIDATASILRHIEVHYPSRPTTAFITPDVFIAAASAGNTDVILFLHGISPIGGSPNLKLITPLQAAVSRGHLGTCQLLLRLYGGLSATLIFIACRHDHLNLLRYLLQNGLSVNEPMISKDARACRALCNGWVDDNASSGQPVTALQYLLNFHARNLQFGWPPDWVQLLIGPDAVLPPGSLVRFAELWWDKPLLAALDAGGSANETSPNGQSALQCALRNHRDRKSAKQLATVKILLERGAQLHGGEVLQAMRIRDRDLVLLLLHHGATLLHTHENIGPTLDAAIMLKDDKLLEAVVAELPGHYDAGSLCSAIESGNTQIINLLLANRPQKAEADLLEGIAVGLAAASGDIQLVQKLLEHLGKPDSALLPCIRLPYIIGDEMWQFDRGSNFWRDNPRELVESNPLTLAVSGDIEGFSELLENGYRPDRLTWLRVASLGHRSCLLERLLHFKQRLDGVPRHPLETASLLCECIEDKNKDVLHYLLKAGADVNEHNCTHIDNWLSCRSPHQKAVEVGNLDIIDLLLQAGAHINAPPSFFGGATTLQIAAIQGNLGLAKQLLDLGARINARGARQCGRTALEGAAEHGRLDMLQLLLHSGALTTGAGQHQFVRAVHFAERRGHDAAADLLRRSREWTDEDADLYEKRSPRCGSGSECEVAFDDGQWWWRCLEDENGRDHCCDEIHSSGGECIHDYTDIEDLWYVDRVRETNA